MFNRVIRSIGISGIVVAAVLLSDSGASGQGAGGEYVHLNRDTLVQLVARLDETANSRGYSEALRERARREADLLRLRLQQGDFQTGDRIYIAVERQPELTDTFTVSPGPTLILPSIRELSLSGLLRAELEPRLREHLKGFLVNPEVQAMTLMRVWVQGGVNNPGVYLLPAQTLITDALMRAGGTSRDAKVTSIRIERGNKRIWEGDVLQRAITEGKTLDQLSLRAGDRIIVDVGSGSAFDGVRNLLMAVVPLLVLIGSLVF